MTENVEKEIIDLYFHKMYSYSQLIKHFNQKYTYAKIKKVIKNYLIRYEEMTNGKILN